MHMRAQWPDVEGLSSRGPDLRQSRYDRRRFLISSTKWTSHDHIHNAIYVPGSTHATGIGSN